MVIRKASWSIILVASLFCVGAMTVNAGDCSVASLKGSFGFVEQGTFLPAPSVMLPYATSGIVTFDGGGHLSGTVAVRAGGAPIHFGTFTGTYTVNPDCTFSSEFTTDDLLVFHQVGTITGEGIFQEGRYIYKDTNLVVSGTAKKASAGK